jgi:predicted nucleic acid-binding protein
LIYLDSSALVKLVRIEPETPTLRAWLDRRKDSPRTTSSLARVEVVRAVLGDGEAAVRNAQAVLVELDQMPMWLPLLDHAGALPFAIRSLDAIHLASAIELGGALDAFVAYDKRLLTAAEQAGLPIESPGAA